MIWSLTGKIVEIFAETVVMEVGGIGYEVYLPQEAKKSLPFRGKDITLYTYMHVKEDACELYGFLQKEHRDFLVLLLNISGVGPRGALSVVNSIAKEDFFRAVILEDVEALKQLPGIGKKTASRMIVELKDRVEKEQRSEYEGAEKEDIPSGGEYTEALQGLLSLGYSSQEVAPILGNILKEASESEVSASELIRRVLQTLAQHK